MQRRWIVRSLTVSAVLLQLTAFGRAQPKQDQAKKDDIYVIVTARLYEVDDATYKKLAKARWLSRADLEEQERQFLKGPRVKPAGPDSLFPLLEKQKPLLAPKPVNIGPGKDGAVLNMSKAVTCLATPDQLRQGKKAQTITEGFTLVAQVHISADRRYVHAKFVEKSLEIEGFEKVLAVVDDKGTEAFGEVVFVKEATVSLKRDIADGGSFLLPLQYRPRSARESDRWLVVHITPRIYIEEEERLIRGLPK